MKRLKVEATVRNDVKGKPTAYIEVPPYHVWCYVVPNFLLKPGEGGESAVFLIAWKEEVSDLVEQVVKIVRRRDMKPELYVERTSTLTWKAMLCFRHNSYPKLIARAVEELCPEAVSDEARPKGIVLTSTVNISRPENVEPFLRKYRKEQKLYLVMALDVTDRGYRVGLANIKQIIPVPFL